MLALNYRRKAFISGTDSSIVSVADEILYWYNEFVTPILRIFYLIPLILKLNAIDDIKISNLDITVNYYFQKNSLELYMSKIEMYLKEDYNDYFEEYTVTNTCKIN